MVVIGQHDTPDAAHRTDHLPDGFVRLPHVFEHKARVNHSKRSAAIGNGTPECLNQESACCSPTPEYSPCVICKGKWWGFLLFAAISFPRVGYSQIDPEERHLIQLGYNQSVEGHGPIAGYGFYYHNQPHFLTTNLTL